MSGLRLIANDISTEIEAAFSGKKATPPSMFDTIATAATGAIKDASGLLKTQGRANIAAAGFSAKWQNAWRVQVYPKSGVSIDASVWAFHKIPYSLVFEEGAHIVGKSGLLWLPLKSAPKIGRKKATPKQLIASGVKLFSLKSKSGKPLLGASVRVSNSQASNPKLSLSLSKLRKGEAGKTGQIRAVPLFFGVKEVDIKPRFNISGVADSIRAQLGELYFANIQAE